MLTHITPMLGRLSSVDVSKFAKAVLTDPSGIWIVPEDVYSISILGVGAGADGLSNRGGGGGALVFVNNISVTPGQKLDYSVGIRGVNGGDTELGDLFTAGGGKSDEGGKFIIKSGLNGMGYNGGNGGQWESGAGGGGGAAGRYDRHGGNGAGYTSYVTSESVWIPGTPANKYWVQTGGSSTQQWEAASGGNVNNYSGSTSTSQPLGATYSHWGISSSGPNPTGAWLVTYFSYTYTLSGTEATPGYWTTQNVVNYSPTNPTGTLNYGQGGLSNTNGEGIFLDGTNVGNGPYGQGGRRSGQGTSGAIRIIWPGRIRQFPNTNTKDP